MSTQEPSSRRSSTQSQSSRSSRSSQNYVGYHKSPRPSHEPRHTSVSMFTGLADGEMPKSPPSRADTSQSTLSPGSIDRVFPIRSAVSIDPNPAFNPMSRIESNDSYLGMRIGIGAEGTLAARRAGSPGRGDRTDRTMQITERSDLGAEGGRDGSPSPPRKSLTAPQRSAETPRSSDQDRIPSYSGAPVTRKVDNRVLNSILSDDGASVHSVKSDAYSSVSGGVGVGVGGSSRAGSFRRNSETHEVPLVTARFKHVVTDGGHAVITGRDGETLQRCEDEPIHIPGAVQSFGLLVAFKEEEGRLVVHIVSENSAQIIGYTPAQLFKFDNFLDIFTEEQADNLLDHLDFMRDEDSSDVVANGPEVFMLSIRPPHHRTRKLWCAMHISPSDKNMVICEFEVEDDPNNPLVPLDDSTPEPPEDTLGSDPTPEELAESTVNVSRPLRVLRSARKKRGEAAAMEIFSIMSQVQEQLASAPNLQVFLRVLIGVVKELSGFHRVMIYQFDQSWNGRVVAELVDPRATKDLYKGLNFPASDIPKQARDMYKVNKVRLLYDRDQETSRLVCRTIEDLKHPLDLTHAYLRAMSPIHIKYLANMAVRSSMSISINAFNELWGLIACHSYGGRGMRVSFPIRKMCRLVGDTASRNIERLSYASRLQARKLINTTSSSQNPSGYIVASSEDLLRLFDADIGALSIRDETKIMGTPSGHLQEVLAMVEFLRLKKVNSVYTSQDIAADFPDLRYGPGLKFLAGVMYVPLSNNGGDFIAFFRRGVLQEVKWAGNPYEKFVKEGTEGYLEPRKSFKTWSETIVGRCRDWTEEEVETASVLCLVYGKFIDVWRQKEAALQNSQLTRLLLANSAHEVRTPLNAIINYLEIALEGSLDQETRDNLARSHSASKSLVYVINDLLDLTKTEEHKNLVKEEVFDLHATLKEATDPFIGDAKRKSIDYTVDIDTNLPARVIGDHRRVRQVVSNLIANAVQYTSHGSVSVEARTLHESASSDKCEVEITVEDTGAGMAQAKVDALFQELEEVHYEPDAPGVQLWDPDSRGDQLATTRTTLGLGLAVVARTIRNMNGQLRLKTEESRGSRFVLVLAFDRDRFTDGRQIEAAAPSKALPAPTSNKGTPDAEGEIMLVNRQLATGAAPSRPSSAVIARKESVESLKSLGSMKSGKSCQSVQSNRSDADRLIDAIQEPFRLTHPPESQARGGLARSHSLGESASPVDGVSPRLASSAREMKSVMAKVPGQERVTDSGIPIRAVRIPDTEAHIDSTESKDTGHRVTFSSSSSPQDPVGLSFLGSRDDTGSAKHMRILVAEDDPINSKIMKKRLEKLGHVAYMTVNGEECASAHGEQSSSFDAVLMDLQMPLVDGFSSTKMIRSFEKTRASDCLSPRAATNRRIPIFAVSASLVEREREKYIETGFDGWILKPVDFKRVDLLLRGIAEDDSRNSCLYQSGKWEQGGWFAKRVDQPDQFEVDTTPSQRHPATEAVQDPETVRGRNSSISNSFSEGSITPTPESIKQGTD